MEISWDAVGAVAEFVGAMAVLATLVYLSIQVRENSLQVKLGSAINLNHLINEAFDPIYNNDRNIRIWTTGISEPESLSEADQAIFSLFMARLVNVLLTALLHDDHAILETDAARRYVGSLKSLLESPGGQYWFKHLEGASQLTDKHIEMISEATDLQDFLVTGTKKA